MVIPFVYLSVPIDGNHKRVNFGKGVLDKVREKLSRWRGKSMSMAGRVMLIKSILFSMFLFYLSIFKVVNKEIIKIQRQFL